MHDVKRFLSLAIAGAVSASAQAPPAKPVEALTFAQKMQASVERQRAAVVNKMAPAVDRQKKSVRRQARQESTNDFFTLAPPPRTLAVLNLPECNALPATDVNQLVETAANKEGLEPALIRSVIKTESAFYPCAISAKGAMGLMQLMPDTADNLAVQDPFDPQQNVDAGAKLLKELLHRYDGDLSLALSAYNAGPARVDRTMSIPAIPETVNYVERILSAYPAGRMELKVPESGGP